MKISASLTPRLPIIVAAYSLLWVGLTAHAQESPAPASKPLLDLADASRLPAGSVEPTSPQVSLDRANDPAARGLSVTIEPGAETYPGIHLKPPGGAWDLSSYGHIEARLFNTGDKPLSIAMRVDGRADGADNTSNTESVTVKPGEASVAKVIFGFTYGYKPSAKPNPGAISKIVFFAAKSAAKQSFRIESIEAAGPVGEKPPIKPEDLRTRPENGLVLGGGIALDPAQFDAKEGAAAKVAGSALQLAFVANKASWVSFKPKAGRWDFRDAFGVSVKFKNIGTTPVVLQAKVNSNGGSTDVAKSGAPVAPGAESALEVPFAPAAPWQGMKDSLKTSWEGQKGTGTKFVSDAVSNITFSAESIGQPPSVLVSSVTVGQLALQKLPDWLGKRPPIEGDWVKTFEENFDGNQVDLSKWNIYTENYWDKRSHFSKDNVVVANGEAKLHYEKKTGFHNDDPNLKKTDYATGFLDTYGKWVQRYGYFEARMKLTRAPGLWPAFWLMPDRGAALGAQWKRASTGEGGMEFDIMEYLGRWGGNRFNIAWHWDGYGKEHQQTGTQMAYFQPDKDGYVTSGLLWLPGLAVIYANGKEIGRWESPRISNVPSDIMFTNVSGGWDNNQIDDSKLSDDFTIDYVRAWQRKDLASPVDGIRQEGRRDPK